ncbi:hypothetical protein B0I37DRAFT_447962 [Chaetomium sp. MPI-CAGE-AT-0009]|nr:hypothetical protein B0I37DRAFT_447962 [Chaetomium sp. MPI-CAGE-AT-0009]
MGARFSKVSCSCTINCHQHPAVHDHSNGVGPCQRCTHLRRLRAGAESRASAASTSTEYLARPRHYVSPSPDADLARHLLLNRSLLPQRAATHRNRRARHNRAISYPDTLPSLSTTTGPTPTPTRSLSPGSTSSSTVLNRTPSLPSSVVRRNTTTTTTASSTYMYTDPVAVAAVDRSQADDSSDDGTGAVEVVVPTPTDLSRSSTAVGLGGWEGGGSMQGGSAAGMSVYSGEGEEQDEGGSGWGL